MRDQLLKANLPITSCTLYPLDFGSNTTLTLDKGYLTMFKQILTCLEATEADIVYFTEHDVLYPREHFDFTPPTEDKFYYDTSWYKVRKDGFAVTWNAIQVSGLCCYRTLAIDFYRKRVESFTKDSFDRKFEPTVDGKYEAWNSKVPLVDIRHEGNLTYNKWHIQHFRDKSTAAGLQETTIETIPGWSLTAKDIYG